MKTDGAGNPYYTADDLCDELYKNGNMRLAHINCTETSEYNAAVNIFASDMFAPIKNFTISDESVDIAEFDKERQQHWFMPDEYKNLNIIEHVLSLCNSDEELERAKDELNLYMEYGLSDLLKFMKYLADTCHQKNILLGVGRGSSVSSFVLYLMGVHRINSLKFGLSIHEFLKKSD